MNLIATGVLVALGGVVVTMFLCGRTPPRRTDLLGGVVGALLGAVVGAFLGGSLSRGSDGDMDATVLILAPVLGALGAGVGAAAMVLVLKWLRGPSGGNSPDR
jgi:hypothetical protein